MHTRFSVVIPVYNVAPYLRECLDSLLLQTFIDWEAVCVDDGSVDGSSEILDEYAERDARLIVVHKKNEGVSIARNTALDLIQGEYVCFLDADDVLNRNWLRVADGILAREHVDLLRLRQTCFRDGTVPEEATLEVGASIIMDSSPEIFSWGWNEFLQRGWSWLNFVRREVIGSSRYPANLAIREDNIFMLRLLPRLKYVALSRFAGYYYRQRQGSAVSHAHTKADQKIFNRSLRLIWRESLPELRRLVDYEAIRLLMKRQLSVRMYDLPRFHPFRIVQSVLRRIIPMKKDVSQSVCFLMGGIDHGPVGGYKVVYEYANRLALAGWRVAIVYPYLMKGDTYPRYWVRRPLSALALVCGYLGHGRGDRVGASWFPLDPRIRRVYPFQNSPRIARQFPKGTRFIATYVPTVVDLNRFEVPPKHKINLIQDYEAWHEFTPEFVDGTYRFPMTKIAISKWIEEKVRQAGSDAFYIPNGLDFNYFKMTKPIESRNRAEVAMLWHRDERKRTEDAIAALRIVREKIPSLHVTAFGVAEKPRELPDWISYIKRPSCQTHNEIYNEAAIFVGSSEQEGWGLTPCEAMICGAAVVCTDIGGYRSFATDGVTALMSPARDVVALAKNICRLIEDDQMRIRIARAGHENIKQFSWERSVNTLIEVLQS